MFKSASVFKFNSLPNATLLEEALNENKFVPCTATQPQSIGWVAPRGVEHGALVEVVNGQYLFKLLIEDKPIPASVIKRHLNEQCDKIEQETGRRPGKKYKTDLKDEIILSLLPHAFPRQKAVNVWINPSNKWLIMDTTSAKQADIVLTALVKSIDGFAVNELHTQASPSVAMSYWLQEDAPIGWTVDMDCKLKADGDALKPVLKYSNMSLNAPEVRDYLDQGMQPVELAMTFGSRVSVVLTDDMKLKKIGFLDVVFESNPNDCDDMFDAKVAIATGELLPLIESLIYALGGESHAI